MAVKDILKNAYVLVNSRIKDDNKHAEIMQRYLARCFKIFISDDGVKTRIKEWKKENNPKIL